jgi:hypothetical protein
MRFSHSRLVVACALLAACGSTAHAQLVIGTTTPTTSNGAAFYYDLTTNTVTTLWNSAANKKVNGIASDPVNGKLYANDAARLNVWNYGSVGIAPTFIAGMYRTNDNISFTATGVDDLTFINNKLYGVTSFGSTTFKKGIYQVATSSDGAATPHCVMTPLWLDPTGTSTSGDVATGGMAYNPANNLFYLTNSADDSGTGGPWTPGIFTVDAFGAGTLTKLLSFPTGHNRIDGLTIGNNVLYMTEQDPANSRINIFRYDLATSTYLTDLSIPLVDGTNRASGVTWAPGANVPAPASIALLGLGGACVARRRRR